MVTDPIADFLTRIRNAVLANHRVVEIPKSKIKEEITRILFEKGYILNFKIENEPRPGTIKIALKYHPVSKLSAINSLVRISKPGLRKYVDNDHLPRVLNGLGIAILSTSHGVMTDKEARTQNVGGEVLCHIS
jgi:small subunit ribosomal protein S8